MKEIEEKVISWYQRTDSVDSYTNHMINAILVSTEDQKELFRTSNPELVQAIEDYQKGSLQQYLKG